MPGDVIAAIRRARAELLARDAYRMRRLMQAYSQIWMRLQHDLDDLYAALDKGETSWARQRVAALRRQVEDELRRYAREADGALSDGMQDGVEMARRYSQDMVRASLGPDGREIVSRLGWNHLPTRAVETILGMTEKGSPLWHRMESRLGPAVAEEVSNHLADGIARGWGPVRIQALLRADLGKGLEWSLTQTRTATLWAYREAERQNWQENPDLAGGWIWRCSKGPRTCALCYMMDGRRFPLSQPMREHWKGRCSMEPIPPEDLRPPGWKPGETGRQWFEKQPPGFQKSVLGPMTYDAWKEGLIKLSDLATTTRDPIYGRMLARRSLADMLARNKAPDGTLSRLRRQTRPPTPAPTPPPPPPAPAPVVQAVDAEIETLRQQAIEIGDKMHQDLASLEARLADLERQFKQLPAGSPKRFDIATEGAALEKRLENLSDPYLEPFRKALHRDPPVDPALSNPPQSLDPGHRTGYDTFRHWVGREEVNGQEIHVYEEYGRSYYDPATRTAYVEVGGGAHHAIHEMGHFLEMTVPDIQQEMLDFYARRTAGEPLVTLKSLFPEINYGPEEVVRVDRWLTPYMGKDYSGIGFNTTELLSTGLEWLYKDPGRLAAQDPEMFRLILNIIRRGHKYQPPATP